MNTVEQNGPLPAVQRRVENDVAIFLDLDNIVIGAKQANLPFDINLILQFLKEMTNGRIVLRRSYGDWRQSQQLLKELASAGFTTQSAVRLNNFSKNIADMQIVVDTMDTLVDGHQYSTYVLVSGDRDFTPLVQSLRKRGKHVIGMGVRHTTSRSFVDLCDEYIFYEDIVPAPKMNEAQVRDLLSRALADGLKKESRIRASVLKQMMSELSQGAFDKSHYAEGSFRKFLESYPQIVEVQQVNTTIYARAPQADVQEKALFEQYRTSLKKRKLRIAPAAARLRVLKDMLRLLSGQDNPNWRTLIDMLAAEYDEQDLNISKNKINATLLAARRAQVIRTLKGTSLATAPVELVLRGEKLFQEAVMRTDAVYLQEIIDLAEPFDLNQAALALFYDEQRVSYLQVLMKRYHPGRD